MDQKLKRIKSLEKILNINEKGDRRYKLKVLSRPFRDKDICLKILLNTKNTIYLYEGELSFYGYKRDGTNIHFDSDGHPYWNAYFDDDKFRLYDGIFLARYGCMGGSLWRNVKEKLYDQLLEDKKLMKKFSSFRKKLVGYELNNLKEEFGFPTEEVKEDCIYFEKDDIVDIFGRWYRRIINKNGAYEKKIEIVTPKEHKKAFEKYINKAIKKIEEKGFKLYEEDKKKGGN